MKYRYLSHLLEDPVPAYGGAGSLGIENTKSIAGGSSSNVSRFSMESHWGTHIDLPGHFFINGRNVSSYPAEYWFFKSPQVIDVTLKPAEILGCSGWISDIRKDSDILLFRSNWSELRRKETYVLENPGIHPDVAAQLRKNFPAIRVVGIDWLSVSSYQNRQIGRAAHRAFLEEEGVGKEILLAEDMDLSYRMSVLREVFIFPLRIKDIDSVPCTAIGGFDE